VFYLTLQNKTVAKKTPGPYTWKFLIEIKGLTIMSSGRSTQNVLWGIISFPSNPRIRLNKHPSIKYNNKPGKNLKKKKRYK